MKKEYLILTFIIVSLTVGILTIKLKNDSLSSNDELIKNEETVETYVVYSYLTNDVIDNAQRTITRASFLHEYTPEYMLEVSDAVAIVSIISVDGADTKYNQAVGNTYGKMVINNVLYGDLETGQVVEYLKSGGIMSLEEYNENQISTMKEKHERLWEENGIDASQIYVSEHFLNDPDIEAGKVYLCYLKYISSIEKYEIVGLGNGFRELNIPVASSVSSQSINTVDYEILNNTTGEYESLNDYIDKYLK